MNNTISLKDIEDTYKEISRKSYYKHFCLANKHFKNKFLNELATNF